MRAVRFPAPLAARWPVLSVLLAVLVLPHVLEYSYGQLAAAPVFLLVTTACAALIFLVRGLGGLTGTVLGAGSGLGASLGLAFHFPDPTALELIAFIVLSMSILGLLGFLAGSCGSREAEARRASENAYGTGSSELEQGQGAALDAFPAAEVRPLKPSVPWEDVLKGILGEFCEWAESELGRSRGAEAGDWAGFDQFLRACLRRHLGARAVRTFALSADGEWLEPLTRSNEATGGRLPARSGLVGQVVASGQVHVSGEETSEVTENAPEFTLPSGAPRWVWLLPIQSARQVVALVAVGRVLRAECRDSALARALQPLLQLMWRYVTTLHSLQQYMSTDRQSGMLERSELLARIEEVAAAATRDREPLAVLALSIEGLRRLDDTARWTLRDRIVERLGQLLRQKVRSDDILGRFTDERFIVVLRRLDTALGSMVAEKLMESLREGVLEVHVPAFPLKPEDTGVPPLRLRGGLAGADFGLTSAGARPYVTFTDDPQPQQPPGNHPSGNPGKALLERALGLLDYARTQHIDLATDLMKGLPEHLARDAAPRGDEPGQALPCPAESEPAQPVGEDQS